jgi:ankyrin repeat protein
MAPLHTAAKQGDLEAVQAALSSGADVNGKDSVRARAAATGQSTR